jgi:regulator of sigma E protease
MDFPNFFMNIFIYTIPFLFVLTVVVFFHELGHFLVARFNKVDVESFSIGFGKKIISYTDKKGTEWKLCWIPLGGYVKFIDDMDPASLKENSINNENGFHNKSIKAKSAIVSAGPIANFILAIIIFTFFYSFYGKTTILPVVESIEEGSPAMQGGVVVGDRFLTMNDTEVFEFNDIPKILNETNLNVINVTVLRSESIVNLKLSPLFRSYDEKDSTRSSAYIGIGGGGLKENVITKKLPIHKAVTQGVGDTYNIINLSLGYLYRIIRGSEPTEHLGGPIRIAQISGDVAKNGIYPLIHLTALLSVSIGLINLFPIPMLDGGHLLFYIIEALRGKPLGDRASELFHKIGLSFIVFLMFFAIWNDLNFLNIF